MGDGCVQNRDGNPYIVVKMVSPNYLDYVDTHLGAFSSGVRKVAGSEELAKNMRDAGINPEANAKNYSDIYELITRSMPEFKEYANWYNGGQKEYPNNFQLTPTVLRHWYVGDGTWSNCNNKNSINIAIQNEPGNDEKIKEIFTNVNLPEPTIITTKTTCEISFKKEDSKEVWKYMQHSLPDFGYKFPDRYQ